MKRFAGVAGSFLCVAVLAGPAHAQVATTAERVAAFEQVAERYWWSQVPSCGVPTWDLIDTSDTTGGDADFEHCTMELSRGLMELPVNDPLNFASDVAEGCYVTVHEYGHLLLGADYFASANPADPAHSPDPGSIMFWIVTDPARRTVRECHPAWVRHGNIRELLVAHVVVAETRITKASSARRHGHRGWPRSSPRPATGLSSRSGS